MTMIPAEALTRGKKGRQEFWSPQTHFWMGVRAGEGATPRMIAEELGRPDLEDTIRCQLQRWGYSAERQGGRRFVKMSAEKHVRLSQAARDRNVDADVLGGTLLTIIVREDMFDAVLDGEAVA